MKITITKFPRLLLGSAFIAAFVMPVHAQPEKSVWTSLKNVFERKEEYMGPVAQKIAELPETGYIWNLDFSPDGRYLAANDTQRLEVNIWELQGQGHIVRTLTKPGAIVTGTNSLRYSPDGNLLAIFAGPAKGNYGDFRIWNPKTGEVIHDIGEPITGGFHSGIAFSQDGRFFIRTMDREPGDQVIVHQTDSWKPVWGLRTVPFYPETLALSADGKWVAVGGHTAGRGVEDHTQLLIVDWAQRSVVRTIEAFPPTNRHITALAWNPDSVQVAVGTVSDEGEDAVRIFDATTGKQVVGESTNGAHVADIAYSADGRYLIETGIEKGVRIWDGQHKTLLQTIPMKSYAVAVSPDSRYIALGTGRKISIWAVNDRPPVNNDK